MKTPILSFNKALATKAGRENQLYEISFHSHELCHELCHGMQIVLIDALAIVDLMCGYKREKQFSNKLSSPNILSIREIAMAMQSKWLPNSPIPLGMSAKTSPERVDGFPVSNCQPTVYGRIQFKYERSAGV